MNARKRHSTDMKHVKDNMKVTFQHRQKVVQEPATASTVLDLFPRFLDTPGLIDQDFTMLFVGEEVSAKFLAKWPTKPRIIKDCKNLSQSTELDELLISAQRYSDEGAFAASLVPPTSKGGKSSKISTSDAAHHLMKFIKVGGSTAAFLKAGSTQPFVLCVGERKNIIQSFYIILDQKVIPCVTQIGALNNFYTFIQTTVYGIDVGSVKESPRVRETRGSLHCTV
ncbi:GPI-anchor transamidase subunit K [Sarotherodon galilaeus]